MIGGTPLCPAGLSFATTTPGQASDAPTQQNTADGSGSKEQMSQPLSVVNNPGTASTNELEQRRLFANEAYQGVEDKQNTFKCNMR